VLVASCCVPGIFVPAMINGEPYIDGGVLDNLPVKPIKAQCDFVIGSACNPISNDFQPQSIKKVIERTMLMAINTNTQISKSLCDIVIEPSGLSKFSGMDIKFAQEIYDIGYTFTKNNFQASDFQRMV
jgi:NTE family protein